VRGACRSESNGSLQKEAREGESITQCALTRIKWKLYLGKNYINL